MKLSIVMAVYNGEKYLYKQLESIKNQTRPADEILIFDDCSTDSTKFLIEKYISDNHLEGWKFMANQSNKGWECNFIEGMFQASGDYIFPCDQDDIWHNNKLETIEKIIEANPKIQLLTTNYTAFYDNGKIVKGPAKENGRIVKQPMKANIFEVKYPGCTYCVSKKLAKKAHEYWQSGFPHDALVWRMSVIDGTAYSYNESLIDWRRHSESTFTVSSKKTKNYDAKCKWLDYAVKIIKSLDLYLNSIDTENKAYKKHLIETNMKFIIQRKKFYKTKNIFIGLSLLRYINYYQRKRQFIGDWIYVFKGYL